MDAVQIMEALTASEGSGTGQLDTDPGIEPPR
jgi:hypothetical protein